MHPARLSIDDLMRNCTVSFSRASGPGGQHRNKVETAVTIEHTPSGIRGTASERRSQQENRSVAMHRLRCELAIAIRSPVDSSGPSETWTTYCQRSRIQIADTNDSFPVVLAEGLDQLAACEWDFGRCATVLGTTASQLVKLFSQYPAAMAVVNRERTQRGLPPRKLNA